MIVAAIAVVGFGAAVVMFARPMGTSVSPVGTLSDAVVTGDVELARSLLADGAEPDEPRVSTFTPLMRAAIRDDPDMVEVLLDAGADASAIATEGLTALHLAASSDSVDALEVLLQAGGDPRSRSTNGMNALDHAAAMNGTRAIATLAALGIEIDAPSEIHTQGHGYPIDIGSTPLGIAARTGSVDAIVTLLDLGARVDAPSTSGHTPLLMAIFSQQPPEVVAILLEAGADPTVTASCRSGCSYDEGDAVTWARRIGHPDVIPLLEAALEKLGS